MATWSSPTNRATGISSDTLNTGANLLSNEIDNETNKDTSLALELTWTRSTSGTANQIIEVYILYALDGTQYEDGGVGVDPFKPFTANFIDTGGTSQQIQSRVRIPIDPFKFKILLKSELSHNATGVTLDAETYN